MHDHHNFVKITRFDNRHIKSDQTSNKNSKRWLTMTITGPVMLNQPVVEKFPLMVIWELYLSQPFLYNEAACTTKIWLTFNSRLQSLFQGKLLCITISSWGSHALMHHFPHNDIFGAWLLEYENAPRTDFQRFWTVYHFEFVNVRTEVYRKIDTPCAVVCEWYNVNNSLFGGYCSSSKFRLRWVFYRGKLCNKLPWGRLSLIVEALTNHNIHQ